MKKIMIGVSVFAIAVGGFFTFADYSDGERAGVVVKFSRKGIVPGCKTWEGEMVLGGLNRSGDANANVWRFTVSDSDLVEKIQNKLETGEHSVLTYSQPYFTMPCTTDTGYFVTEVK